MPYFPEQEIKVFTMRCKGDNMNIEQIKDKVRSKEYSFLRENEHLGKNIILLGLGGSHAYGTETETSDLDVRGIALNSKSEILLSADFEQFVNEDTDTTIYSFNKMITLLTNCNPNTIEILGLKPEHYLYVTPIGQEIIDNRRIFLSKKAACSFGGYANQQLYRLKQKTAHRLSQAGLEEHILKTLLFMKHDFSTKYSAFPEDSINLYIDEAEQEGYDTEIFMDIVLHHYPLRDYASMWSELQNVVKSYSKVGKRNEHALLHGKITKHMMHLIRLYMMCLDILENKEIITYRKENLDLLMKIRNGAFLDENQLPKAEFFEMVKEYEKCFEYAVENTDLPEEPNYTAINEFKMSINERVVRGEI